MSSDGWVGEGDEAVPGRETELLAETRALFMLGGQSGSQQMRPTLDRARNSRMKTIKEYARLPKEIAKK